STVENIGPTRIKLAVELPFAELQPSIDAALKRVGAQLRVPGFRPGKVPARVIEQRVGRAAVLEEAVNEALPKAYSEAVQEAGVQAVGQPEIEVTNLDDGNSLSFTAEVDIRPEITLPDYAAMTVKVDDAAANDDQVEEQLDSLRDRFGTLTTVERPVDAGDYVSIDLIAKVDGVEVEGGSATGLSYQVGTGDLVDGLDEVITGASAGDTKTFPSTLSAGDFAGQDSEITVTINSVKTKELPDADDEFAQLASEFDTLDELKADLRERLGRVAVMTQGAQARDLLIEQLLESTEVPLPESAVKAEVEWREHDVIHQLEHDDARFEEFLAEEGKTREEFQAELRETAEKSVKSQFLLDAIADAEQVTVGDAELTEYLVRQAARYGMPAQEFANELLKAGNLPSVIQDVRRNKALAGVLEKATIEDASGRPVDLSVLTSNPTAIAEAGEEDEV
ncbi:MAG: trigger factor, partial [Pseudonocardiales bacterium]|nr:trigger factor [Pseudonocardiales bacterium]